MSSLDEISYHYSCPNQSKSGNTLSCTYSGGGQCFSGSSDKDGHEGLGTENDPL